MRLFSKSNKRNKNKGFTIPELLVVITIILILAAIGFVYYAPQKAKTRDSKRITEINDLRKAVQMYYLDHGHYPTSTESEDWCSLEQTDPSADDYCDYLRDALVPHYIKDLPQDPLYPKTEGSKFYSYQYISTSSASQYKFHTDLETRPPYEVYSMGGKAIAYNPSGGGGGGGATCGNGVVEPPDEECDGIDVGGTTCADLGFSGGTLTCNPDCTFNVSGCVANQFIKAIGEIDVDLAECVQQTSDGGYIVAGETESFGAVNWDSFLVKLDSKGDLCTDPAKCWAKTVRYRDFNFAYSVQQTSDGGYIVAGRTGNTGIDSNDLFLVKLDSKGDLCTDPAKCWARVIGGTNYYYDTAYSVQQTSDGGYIVAGETGSFGAGSGDRNIFLVKLDSKGDLCTDPAKCWVRSIGGSAYDTAYSVQQTSDGGYIVAGTTKSFGSNKDFLLVKLDSNGDLCTDPAKCWARVIGGDNDDTAYSVQQTSDGGYIVAGETGSFSSSEVLLVKLDSKGDLCTDPAKCWVRSIGGSAYDTAYSVQQTSDGGYIVAGETESFGDGICNFFLVKFDYDGTNQWTKAIGETGCNTAKFIRQTLDGGYIVTGLAGVGAGSLDFLLVKLDSEGNTCDLAQSVSPTVTSLSLTVTSPSPTVTSPSPTVTSPSPIVTSVCP